MTDYGDGPPLGCERCELCEGTGTVYVTAGAFGPPEGLPGECWECAGRGWVEGEGVDDESD